MAFNNVQPQGLNPAIANLFKPLGQATSLDTTVRKGSLISFNYSFWVHDPYPLIIVTDLLPNNRVRGVNLHYLSYVYIKTLLRGSLQIGGLSYGNIKSDKYITNAFRSYKWMGIRQIKKLDCNFLLTVMATVRSFDPNQVRAIRESIQAQISREANPKAEPTGEIPI